MIKNFIVAVILGHLPGLRGAGAALSPLHGAVREPRLAVDRAAGRAARAVATANPLSLPVYIGILMLLGIVAKNSILLIDFALEEMNKGVPVIDAIIDAGHKRASRS